MSRQKRLLSELADQETRRISRRVIRLLQAMKDGLLSGDDSILENAWEEICVQVQDQKSFHWEACEDTTLCVILQEVEKTSVLARQVIWLQTDRGQEWASMMTIPKRFPLGTGSTRRPSTPKT
jgi:hypothetical protein